MTSIADGLRWRRQGGDWDIAPVGLWRQGGRSPRARRHRVELIRNGLFVLPQSRRLISIRHTDRDLEATFAAASPTCQALKA